MGPKTLTKSKGKGTIMAPHVNHPYTGMQLTETTQRCGCGGVIGICGTAAGAKQWRSHINTDRHHTWDPELQHT